MVHKESGRAVWIHPRSLMKLIPRGLLVCAVLLLHAGTHPSSASNGRTDNSFFGYRDSSAQAQLEARFLAVPDPARAQEHLRILTGRPKTRRPPTTWLRNFARPGWIPRSWSTGSGSTTPPRSVST